MRLFILVLFFQTLVQAQIIGLKSYSGTGCPEGSVNSTLTEDGSIISILFDGFQSETNAQKLSILNYCSVNVEVHIPKGHKISQFKTVDNGFYHAPRGSWGRFFSAISGYSNNEYLWSYLYKDFYGATEGNLVLENKVEAKNKNYETCPEKNVNIKVSAGFWLLSKANVTEFALASIDSVDSSLNIRETASAQHSVLFEKCNERPVLPVKPSKPGRPSMQQRWK